MKKKLLSFVLALLLLLCIVPAHAAYGTLYMVIDCASAPMYAACTGEMPLLRYVNAGEIVHCIATLADYYCVAYGNSTGYISRQYLAAVDDNHYTFKLPGVQYGSAVGGNPVVPYGGIPFFRYTPHEAQANQKLATRSGPGTEYTGTLTYPKETKVKTYYITDGSGVDWVCFSFTYRGEDYLLYTGNKRIDSRQALPVNREEKTFPAYITKEVTPFYGPGYTYARAEHTVPAGSAVQGVYQTTEGWLMFDYQVPGGRIQRAWAPLEYWK
ncbi:MAG: hypothetical protein IKW00_09755 [Clostridia bacterium]|nr:hypothetical protein [Clostridia bacterium]